MSERKFELNIVSDQPNPAVGRREICFEVHHEQSSTPTRLEVKEKLAAKLNADPSTLIIEKMVTKVNSWKTVGTAYLYDSAERAKLFTPKHILRKEFPEEAKAEEKAGEGEAEKAEKGGEEG
ncbi:MAG: 30S ribosomal protein S24e [Candidatus Hecatellales archaeon]|nr:MAG: 30S ribosomal protein S24e [Candidatus Hecatellales archaeon]